MGSEFGHSQNGNNNAYAQDNDVSWLDWEKADPNLLAFTTRALALRRATPAFTDEHFLTGEARDKAPPDVQWLGEDGAPLTWEQWGERHFLAAVFSVGEIPRGSAAQRRKDFCRLPAGDARRKNLAPRARHRDRGWRARLS